MREAVPAFNFARKAVTHAQGVSGVLAVKAPSHLPLNGTSWPWERRPAPVAFACDDAMDGVAGERDVGPVGEMG